MMFGLLGLTVIAVTIPLSAAVFSAIGLGPTGTQTAPFRLMACLSWSSPRGRASPSQRRCRDRSPLCRSILAIAATARGRARRPVRLAARYQPTWPQESWRRRESPFPAGPNARARGAHARGHGQARGRRRPAGRGAFLYWPMRPPFRIGLHPLSTQLKRWAGKRLLETVRFGSVTLRTV